MIAKQILEVLKKMTPLQLRAIKELLRKEWGVCFLEYERECKGMKSDYDWYCEICKELTPKLKGGKK